MSFSQVKRMMDMGFPRATIMKALSQARGDENGAIEIILSGLWQIVHDQASHACDLLSAFGLSWFASAGVSTLAISSYAWEVTFKPSYGLAKCEKYCHHWIEHLAGTWNPYQNLLPCFNLSSKRLSSLLGMRNLLTQDLRLDLDISMLAGYQWYPVLISPLNIHLRNGYG